MTLNLAAIPLLWVIPLTLYLLSFIFVFAKWPPSSHRLMIRTLPVLILIYSATMVPDTPNFPLPVTIALRCHAIRGGSGVPRRVGLNPRRPT
ncbi:MAG: hypothetical protein U0231_16310 [Nitrospiraceae bacterium]